ncbi:hypothetical protein [Sorangium sp. So ce1099]|uniref:hypothetical protein n=1 Tax=Sorangium sp. So ce1099 TaxID=3133331 RepID=UPI003F5E8CFD
MDMTMRFEVLTPDSYARRVADRYGGHPDRGTEVIAEVTRAELFALGQTLRWVLVQRVEKLLSLFGVTAERIGEIVRTLEAIGDLSAGPGGEVACAPLRGVRVSAGRWLLVGTLPSSEMTTIGHMAGLPRRLSVSEDQAVQAWVEERSGRVIDVARWAGLDRSAPHDRWLGKLAARLDAASRFEDRASALSWDDLGIYQPKGEDASRAARWKRGPLGGEPALVRARQTGGWSAYAWARASGDKRAFVPLTGDEARRTMFAVDAAAGLPVRFDVTRTDGGQEIALPVLLPAAEYRLLAAVGEMLDEPRRVRLDEGALEQAAVLLRERLGAAVEEARREP